MMFKALFLLKLARAICLKIVELIDVALPTMEAMATGGARSFAV